ncbi:hypothetical protein A2631_01875 [Candidatus Daviesbacteria bacterium RIFCSPHIGHO2_01_FULL_44_29]|uniref:Phosphodiester glycosidase domain-containing protein n=1 Tax=Candidatus Daviesbacteria bacterium RIFCSPHIGHO2_02_FULL_43_12 TaxID=1797776 RepID=A0A1F5KJN2_9BACT|nr:MAG: hypothetical protein A2631_01875 [Candidatus Daviesbacteria bacterium RIFCSPHIGHO2_01_FULL_44_29]OGE39576.1 MAG: hypothetical protein A3E86_02030 [Candidatus Daviesbacteria bacterium RIFCSPHIGHO2_12_FULL_47_45]OGE41147.1 MAG: hypothetical protein A3D25_01270 [Candidatus Daviesbacteria bacterium RIFCSPHIGHO2_02_FULL_43_12]OGE69346.1 MAG: hypothetical protein A3B55_03010 [Candidatus Daviesbacteria bacterium RIFCSPLOWO2_01_FULL_43_15]
MFKKSLPKKIITSLIGLLIVMFLVAVGVIAYNTQPKLQKRVNLFLAGDKDYQTKIASLLAEVETVKSTDQIKRNDQLEAEIKNIQITYMVALSLYERVLDLKIKQPKNPDLDTLFAASLKYLSDRNYTSGSATLAKLDKQIQEIESKLAQTTTQGTTLTVIATPNNSPPGSGYSRQSVQSDLGTFVVDLIAADLNSNKVIIDTASDGDCSNDCPVMPLASYASRSGAWAGINGSFFCPSEYPSCAGKTNSFDTLLMNKNKTYFNSANNVYSTVPVAIFWAGSARFVGQSLEWGRDAGVDAVIANYPLLVAGDNIVYSGSSNAKFNAKGARGFIASKGGTAYIGFVYNANMSDSAHVLKTLGMNNALNLDEGGSTALWVNGGYRTGPGRNIPNAVLFVKR